MTCWGPLRPPTRSPASSRYRAGSRGWLCQSCWTHRPSRTRCHPASQRPEGRSPAMPRAPGRPKSRSRAGSRRRGSSGLPTPRSAGRPARWACGSGSPYGCGGHESSGGESGCWRAWRALLGGVEDRGYEFGIVQWSPGRAGGPSFAFPAHSSPVQQIGGESGQNAGTSR